MTIFICHVHYWPFVSVSLCVQLKNRQPWTASRRLVTTLPWLATVFFFGHAHRPKTYTIDLQFYNLHTHANAECMNEHGPLSFQVSWQFPLRHYGSLRLNWCDKEFVGYKEHEENHWIHTLLLLLLFFSFFRYSVLCLSSCVTKDVKRRRTYDACRAIRDPRLLPNEQIPRKAKISILFFYTMYVRRTIYVHDKSCAHNLNARFRASDLCTRRISSVASF